MPSVQTKANKNSKSFMYTIELHYNFDERLQLIYKILKVYLLLHWNQAFVNPSRALLTLNKMSTYALCSDIISLISHLTFDIK